MRRTVALWLSVSSLACAGAAGLAAPAALAAGSQGVTISTTGLNSATQPNFSLSNGGAVAAPQTNTVVPVTTTSTGGGLSTLDGWIIGIVAFLLLGGIAFWVWYDARGTVARAGHGDHDDAMFGQRAHPGSKAPRRPRKLKPAERKRRKRGRAR